MKRDNKLHVSELLNSRESDSQPYLFRFIVKEQITRTT
jgi:hypothetical protein